MKRYGLGVLLLIITVVIVGCGNSMNKMDDQTKVAVKTVLDFSNKYNKKNNAEQKDYGFDSGYFPINLSEKDVLQVHLWKAKNESNNIYFIQYKETEFSDPKLKKKIREYTRESAAIKNGSEFESMSESEFNTAIEQENVSKIFEAKE